MFIIQFWTLEHETFSILMSTFFQHFHDIYDTTPSQVPWSVVCVVWVYHDAEVWHITILAGLLKPLIINFVSQLGETRFHAGTVSWASELLPTNNKLMKEILADVITSPRQLLPLIGELVIGCPLIGWHLTQQKQGQSPKLRLITLILGCVSQLSSCIWLPGVKLSGAFR